MNTKFSENAGYFWFSLGEIKTIKMFRDEDLTPDGGTDYVLLSVEIFLIYLVAIYFKSITSH